MVVYVVFSKDFKHRKGNLMGMLVERRVDLRGKTRLESGLKWAKLAFGHLVQDKKDIFVFPKELGIKDDEGFLVEQGIFNREEYMNILDVIDRKIKKERKGH